MTNVVNFPIIPRHVTQSNDARAEAIEGLAKSIQNAVSVCGRKFVFDQLTEAMRIADTSDWRAKARKAFTQKEPQ